MQVAREQTEGGTSRELLTFTLGNEEYGIGILKVQAPEFIKGVTNLRRIIVPVADMRIKFKLCSATYDETTVVIILNLASRVVGMVVDGVSYVTTLKRTISNRLRNSAPGLDATHLQGLDTADDRMIILADIEKLVTSRDMDWWGRERHNECGKRAAGVSRVY